MDVFKDIFNGKKAGYNPQLTKVNLKLAITRIDIQKKKKMANNDMMRREIATLLTNGKEESAIIKAENILREEKIIEAYNILEVDIETLLLRVQGINLSSVSPPPDILQALLTTIYASQRVDLKELKNLNMNWKFKYGQQFLADAFSDRRGLCNQKIVELLSYRKGSRHKVFKILDEVAKRWEVNWSPPEEYIAEEVHSGFKHDEEEDLLNELEKFSLSYNKDQDIGSTNWDDFEIDDDYLSSSLEIKLPSIHSENTTNTYQSVPEPTTQNLPPVPTFAGFEDDFETEFDIPVLPPPTPNTPSIDPEYDALTARLNALKK